MKNRYIFLILILLGLNFPIHDYFVKYYSKMPLDAQVSLGLTGKISKQIEIRMPQKYDINLVFNKKNYDYHMLLDAVKSLSSKHNIPIRWSLIDKKSKKIIYKDKAFQVGGVGYSRKDISLTFGKFMVPPGMYTLVITVVKNIPELLDINTSVQVSYNSKSGTTWHSTYMWWGVIFNYFLSPILIIFLIIMLIRNNMWRFKALKK